ncbi:MAG: reverse transcriptase domain-containing protein [Minisyncoccia bacterium]|jgi:retron-type reverse transcriptase
MKIYKNIFERIISPENLFSAWDSFKSDKRGKPDVQSFEWNLERNIFQLHRDLKSKTYKHGPYKGFYITDPKLRHIHKATVRDRILHHAVFSVVNPVFEPTFIPTSFSCRVGFGTHKGVEVLEKIMREVSRNNTHPCFVLKCDVRKFFDSVSHEILLSIIKKRIKDVDALWLLESIVRSYESAPGKGIPIGNLTSQLFANVYMNELDQFVKHRLKVKHYVRYTDDFALVSESPEELEKLLNPISEFLENELALKLHPNKSILRSVCQGVDFLGYVIFPHHRLIRSKTKHRMFKKMEERMKKYETRKISKLSFEQSIQSYLGVLSHANTRRLSERLKNEFWFQSHDYWNDSRLESP